jgi:chitinase
LYTYGNGNNMPSGYIGQTCFVSESGEGQDCTALAGSITTCQAAGIKIILSLGGANSYGYSLQSNSEAEQIGQYLWDAYANSGNTSVERPFGDGVYVNGFDFDIETNGGSSQYYASMISTLRSNFASDTNNKYYITGAPQCPIPEPNMGVIIGNSTFDYLWVQFYNNNNGWPSTPNTTYESCSLGFDGNAPFNYDQWVDYIATTPSSGAKIFIGVPAAPLASNGNPDGEVYYATPAQIATLVSEYKSNPVFGGIMMWNAGFSDSNVNNSCTFAQETYEILNTGSPCGGSGSTGPGTTTTTTISSTETSTTKTTATTTSTGTPPVGTVGAYDQCGGSGYSGSTNCIAGYVCTEISSAWSQCDPA